MQYAATIDLKEKASDQVYLMRFKLKEPATMEFKPGQFVSLDVGNFQRRSYSIGSDPNEKTYIDLYNDVAPMGPGSKFFLEKNVGDEVKFLGPLGQFIYREGSSLPVVFAATNTGVVPFYSMIFHALKYEKTTRPMKLYFGCRYEKDLFLIDQLRELENLYPNFELFITLSRPDENWKGNAGRITEYLKNDIKQGDQVETYICGGQGMISEVNEIFLSKGVSPDHIYFEKFY